MARDLASVNGRQIAEGILGRLLDRFEEGQTRLSEAVPKVSLLFDEKEAFDKALAAAKDAQSVDLEFGRHDLRDHVLRVRLKDPGPLYPMLGRRRPADVAAEARDAITARLPDVGPEILGALERVAAAWAERRNLVRDLRPGDVDDAVGVLKAVAGLLGRRRGGARDDDMDMRTFSRRQTGYSKFVEGNVGKIVDVLRMVADVPEYLDAAEVLAHHGLKKWPHACLLAGPVTYKGTPLPTEPYIGIAPEMAAHLSVEGAPRWMITVENFASFNRQVREAADPDGIVVYTGGFPSDSTLEAILTLARATECPVFHWGDIDAGGIKIAYHIERALTKVGRRLNLHLMTPEIAVRHGLPQSPTAVFRNFADEGSAVAGLVVFMASEAARSLEQEELDPVVPMTVSPAGRIG